MKVYLLDVCRDENRASVYSPAICSSWLCPAVTAGKNIGFLCTSASSLYLDPRLLHLLSYALMCTCVHAYPVAPGRHKNTPVHKHVCILRCSENEAIIETKPMQHQCLKKKNTPANTACSSSCRLFFCPPSSVMAVCLASKVDQGACTQKSLVASRITTLEAKRGADPLKRSSYSRRQQMQN